MEKPGEESRELLYCTVRVCTVRVCTVSVCTVSVCTVKNDACEKKVSIFISSLPLSRSLVQYMAVSLLSEGRTTCCVVLLLCSEDRTGSGSVFHGMPSRQSGVCVCVWCPQSKEQKYSLALSPPPSDSSNGEWVTAPENTELRYDTVMTEMIENESGHGTLNNTMIFPSFYIMPCPLIPCPERQRTPNGTVFYYYSVYLSLPLLPDYQLIPSPYTHIWNMLIVATSCKGNRGPFCY